MRLDDAGPRTWLLATVAGWALLAWLLALAGMGRHAPGLEADPSLLRPLPSSRAAAAERLGPLAQYSQMGTRPLFSQDRQPKPFFLAGQGEGDNKNNAFDYVLTSVLIAPNLHMAILQPADGSESVRVKLGDVPESHPSWRLTALDARSAVFEGPEGRREMTLRVFDGQGGEPPTALNMRPPGAQQPVGTSLPAGVQPSTKAASPQRPAANAARALPGGPYAAAGPGSSAQAPARPVATPENDDAPITPEAQMEAIRKRIEARRAQMRQQQAAQPPAQTP